MLLSALVAVALSVRPDATASSSLAPAGIPREATSLVAAPPGKSKHKKHHKRGEADMPDDVQPYEWPDLVIMHIPKTAVDSFCSELIKGGMWKNYTGRILCHGEALKADLRVSPVQENCFSSLPPGNTFTLFREPRRHVLSQYSECRYDSYYAFHATPGRPETACDDHNHFNESCLSEWMDHASVSTSDDGYGLDCYHPYNMQARYLTCTTRGHLVHSLEERTPSQTAAVQSLNKLTLVGITDLYDETWCYLQYKITEKLPAECTCSKIGAMVADEQVMRLGEQASDVAGSERTHVGEQRITHGVPHLNEATLSDATLAQIDAATTVDQAVYLAAAVRFLTNLCALQQDTQRPLVCPTRMSDFRAAGEHIHGFTAAVDNAIRPCVSASDTAPAVTASTAPAAPAVAAPAHSAHEVTAQRRPPVHANPTAGAATHPPAHDAHPVTTQRPPSVHARPTAGAVHPSLD